MCELFAMSSSKPSSVSYSLEEFARHGGATHSNTSCWGIAFFEGREALVIKEPEPAHDSPWVRFVADQGLSSACVIAHVRLATVGKPKLHNTHPFRRALGGRVHIFAHNGTLHGLHDKFPVAERQRVPVGETDSELAFCVLLERLAHLWNSRDAIPDVSLRLEIFAAFADEMADLGNANFLYSDGDTLFVHAHRRVYEENGGYSDPRPPGLSVRNCAACAQGPEWGVEGCRVKLGDQRTMLFASVPLDTEGWEPLPEACAMAVRGGEEVARLST